MGVTDWEPRALPSEARCQRWYEQGGRLLVTWASGVVTTLEPVDGAFCAPSNIVHVRPWKDNNPATWSDFYAATHPPIPEGWEAGIGGWYEFVAGDEVTFGTSGVIRFWDDFTLQDRRHHAAGDRSWSVEVRRTLPAIPAGWEAVGEWHDTLSPCSEVYDWTLLQDGRIVQRGEAFRTNGERIMGVHIRRVLPAVDWGDVPRGVELRPHGDTHIAVWKGGGLLGLIHQQPDCKWTARKVDGSGLYGNQPSDIAAIVALTGRRDE